MALSRRLLVQRGLDVRKSHRWSRTARPSSTRTTIPEATGFRCALFVQSRRPDDAQVDTAAQLYMVRHANQSPAAANIDSLAPALHVGEAVTHRQPQGIACRTSPFRVVIAHLRLVIPSGRPILSCRADVENVHLAVEKFDFNATSRASHRRVE